MSLDIQHILDAWPFKPGEINVRRVLGDDGREKIQLRLDLGVLQMETTGRPDGQMPFGFPSLLDYHEERLRQHREDTGGDEAFLLDVEECESLRIEGVMYYHRYLAAFVLGDYPTVQRDTRRNLRLFDFLGAQGPDENERLLCEQYRPYVLMMHTRAKVRTLIKQNRAAQALRDIDDAISQIYATYERFSQDEDAESSNEIVVLTALRAEVNVLIPVDPRTQLQKQLQAAIQNENYEQAATLRDQLRKMES